MTPEEHYAAAEKNLERVSNSYYRGPIDDRLTAEEVVTEMSIALVHATLANAGAHAPRYRPGGPVSALAEHDHLPEQP